MKKLAEIKPNPKNPRIISEQKLKELARSLKEFPEMLYYRPIVVNKKGVILGGNSRYYALLDLGYEEVPDEWIVEGKKFNSAKKERQFVIRDNINHGNWDFDVIANEWDPVEVTEWGLPVWTTEDDVTEIDEELDEPKPPTAGSSEYSMFSIILHYDTKVMLVQLLDRIMEEYHYEKQEEALLKIIQSYRDGD